MKLTENEMIKIYACLASFHHDLYKGSEPETISHAYNVVYEFEKNDLDFEDRLIDLEKLMMKFYCEIKNEKILDKIDNAIDGTEEE